MFFLLYRHTDDGVIDDFPKISEDSPKFAISEIIDNPHYEFYEWSIFQ